MTGRKEYKDSFDGTVTLEVKGKWGADNVTRRLIDVTNADLSLGDRTFHETYTFVSGRV